MKLADLTEDMVEKSMADSIASIHISNADISGDKFVILKYTACCVPLVLIQDYSANELTHDQAIAELQGSIWQTE